MLDPLKSPIEKKEYIKFNTIEKANTFLAEINKRMGLNSNLTSTYATPRIDIDGNYVIPKPKQSALVEVKKLVRDIKVNTVDEEGNEVISDGIEIVNKQFDEEGNDITVYDGSEYDLITQVDISTLFSYTEIENPTFPVSEEV